MKCFHPRCTVNPETGGTLFRINAKGQPAIWACREHRAQTDRRPDKELDTVVGIIEQSQSGKPGNSRG